MEKCNLACIVCPKRTMVASRGMDIAYGTGASAEEA